MNRYPQHHAQNRPDAADEEVAEDDAEEERQRGAVAFEAEVA